MLTTLVLSTTPAVAGAAVSPEGGGAPSSGEPAGGGPVAGEPGGSEAPGSGSGTDEPDGPDGPDGPESPAPADASEADEPGRTGPGADKGGPKSSPDARSAAEGDPGATDPGTSVPDGFRSGIPPCCGDPVPHQESAVPPYYTFVSIPDFLNADIGDLGKLDSWFARFWDGMINSWSDTYRRALDVVLGDVKAQDPDDILVAGDLVEGHWGVDADDTNLFGPVDTLKRKRNAVARAGKFYYREWLELFSSRGLPQPHIAVGDHEVGDNPWYDKGFKHRAVWRFKDTLAKSMLDGRYPTWRRPRGTPFERTSYWTPLNDEVMLVSVDVMRRFPKNVDPKQGALNSTLDGEHLAWFKRTLRKGKRDFEWVIVQAHTPIVQPVRYVGSQNMTVVGKMRSPMWKAMVKHDVDLYLSGEVHRVTAIDPKGDNPVQISHGGLFAFGGSRFLTADFFGNRIELSSYGFVSRAVHSSPRLWQTSRKRATPTDLEYRPGAVLRGTAVLYRNGAFRKRSGDLAPARDIKRRR